MMQLYHADCLTVLASLPDNCFDSLITDPPAGIGFSKHDWDKDKPDWVQWLSEIFSASLRVLRPGSHALVWSIPRTAHRTATAMEEAGFEIRDMIFHFFGSGFPKSTNTLKPAVECWILARKPLTEKTVKANVEKWGTGKLNIDNCRTPYENEDLPRRVQTPSQNGGNIYNRDNRKKVEFIGHEQGRFPTNLICSDPELLGEKARYFYCPKATGKEKAGNNHPTVKPLALMDYLCRLITPAKGTVLDIFMGSGSTGVAALRAGFDFVGIEANADYFKIAEARISA